MQARAPGDPAVPAAANIERPSDAGALQSAVNFPKQLGFSDLSRNLANHGGSRGS